jgi:hypothetical protein
VDGKMGEEEEKKSRSDGGDLERERERIVLVGGEVRRAKRRWGERRRESKREAEAPSDINVLLLYSSVSLLSPASC